MIFKGHPSWDSVETQWTYSIVPDLWFVPRQLIYVPTLTHLPLSGSLTYFVVSYTLTHLLTYSLASLFIYVLPSSLTLWCPQAVTRFWRFLISGYHNSTRTGHLVPNTLSSEWPVTSRPQVVPGRPVPSPVPCGTSPVTVVPRQADGLSGRGLSGATTTVPPLPSPVSSSPARPTPEVCVYRSVVGGPVGALDGPDPRGSSTSVHHGPRGSPGTGHLTSGCAATTRSAVGRVVGSHGPSAGSGAGVPSLPVGHSFSFLCLHLCVVLSVSVRICLSTSRSLCTSLPLYFCLCFSFRLWPSLSFLLCLSIFVSLCYSLSFPFLCLNFPVYRLSLSRSLYLCVFVSCVFGFSVCLLLSLSNSLSSVYLFILRVSVYFLLLLLFSFGLSFPSLSLFIQGYSSTSLTPS